MDEILIQSVIQKNKIMAVFNSFNVYGINSPGTGIPGTTPLLMGFHASTVIARPAPANTTVGTTSIYGILQVLPSGLTTNAAQYYVTETVAQIVTKFA